MRSVRDHRFRVAHITLGLDVGGQEKLLVEFARHADRRRFELTFVSLTTRGKLAGALEECGWRVIALDEPPGLRPGMSWRLARLFREGGFEAVHTHDDKPLLYAAPAARLAGVPRIVHTHHHGPLTSLKRRHAVLAALAARLTDRFVCVSHHARRWLIQQGAPARKLTTISNGIDINRFSVHQPSAADRAVVVSVARLSPEKDHETLLRAMCLARQQLPEIRLELYGDGPCRPALQSRVTAWQLGGHVAFRGETHDVPAALVRAGIFVLSSVTEGLSLTLLEAMASGLAVVATRVGGTPEIVVDGETGVLVPPRDPDALARAIVRVLGDPTERTRLGHAGRRRVERLFDVRRMVAAYETLYGRMLGHRQSSIVNRQASRVTRGPMDNGPLTMDH